MTLAIAASCPAGAVLLTDSLQIRRLTDAASDREIGRIVPGKITHLAQAGLCYVHSGLTCEVEDFTADGF